MKNHVFPLQLLSYSTCHQLRAMMVAVDVSAVSPSRTYEPCKNETGVEKKERSGKSSWRI